MEEVCTDLNVYSFLGVITHVSCMTGTLEWLDNNTREAAHDSALIYASFTVSADSNGISPEFL